MLSGTDDQTLKGRSGCRAKCKEWMEVMITLIMQRRVGAGCICRIGVMLEGLWVTLYAPTICAVCHKTLLDFRLGVRYATVHRGGCMAGAQTI